MSVQELSLEYKREKSFVSHPQTIIIIKVVILAISRDTFNKIQVVSEPLERDP